MGLLNDSFALIGCLHFAQFLVVITMYSAHAMVLIVFVVFVEAEYHPISEGRARHRIHDTHKRENFRHVLGNTSCYTPRSLEAMA